MITPVSYADILAVPELLAEYAAECSIPEIGTVNPQGEIYAVLERAGFAKMFGAFHVETFTDGASNGNLGTATPPSTGSDSRDDVSVNRLLCSPRRVGERVARGADRRSHRSDSSFSNVAHRSKDEFSETLSSPMHDVSCSNVQTYGADSNIGNNGDPCHIVPRQQLVGFASVLVSVLPHYGRKVATLESLFVSAPHRSGGKGAHLMAAVEEFARQSGCVAILYSAPAGGKLERLLTIQRKYRLTNSVFCRSLS